MLGVFCCGGSGSEVTQASPVAAGLTEKAIARGTYLSAWGVSDAIEVTEGAFARVSGLWFTLNDGGGFLGGVDLTNLFDGVGHGVFLMVSCWVGYRKCSARIAGFWICGGFASLLTWVMWGELVALASGCSFTNSK